MSTEFVHPANLPVGDGSSPVQDVGSRSIPTFVDAVARDAAIPAPLDGQHAHLSADAVATVRQSGLWVNVDEQVQVVSFSFVPGVLAPGGSAFVTVPWPSPYAVVPVHVQAQQTSAGNQQGWWYVLPYSVTTADFRVYAYSRSRTTSTNPGVTCSGKVLAWGGVLS